MMKVFCLSTAVALVGTNKFAWFVIISEFNQFIIRIIMQLIKFG